MKVIWGHVSHEWQDIKLTGCFRNHQGRHIEHLFWNCCCCWLDIKKLSDIRRWCYTWKFKICVLISLVDEVIKILYKQSYFLSWGQLSSKLRVGWVQRFEPSRGWVGWVRKALSVFSFVKHPCIWDQFHVRTNIFHSVFVLDDNCCMKCWG